jgi:hypothetical protein
MYGWVEAGFLYCQLFAGIVGELALQKLCLFTNAP